MLVVGIHVASVTHLTIKSNPDWRNEARDYASKETSERREELKHEKKIIPLVFAVYPLYMRRTKAPCGMPCLSRVGHDSEEASFSPNSYGLQWLSNYLYSNHRWMCYTVEHSFLVATVGEESSGWLLEGMHPYVHISSNETWASLIWHIQQSQKNAT